MFATPFILRRFTSPVHFVNEKVSILAEEKVLRSEIKVNNLNVSIGGNHILKNINLEIPNNKITCIIGPSGCGKSTLLKIINRLIDDNDKVKVDGEIVIDGENIYG